MGPSAGVAHDARGGPGDHEGADDVDVEHLANEGGWRFEGSTVGGDAGRIDHAVDAAERLARHGDRLFRGGLVGDIERLGEQALRLGNALRKLCQCPPIAIDGRHLPTRAEQPCNRGTPDARPRAGDECHPVASLPRFGHAPHLMTPLVRSRFRRGAHFFPPCPTARGGATPGRHTVAPRAPIRVRAAARSAIANSRASLPG